MPPVLHGEAEAGRLRRPRRAVRAPLRQAQGQEVAPTSPVLPAERRAALHAAKLRVLARDNFGVEGDASGNPGGASLAAGSRGWFLAEERPGRALGPALAWARQAGVEELHVLAEDGTGILARRAALFARRPSVWQVRERTTEPADADPPLAAPPLDPRVEELRRAIAAAGAEPVVEHGVLAGEVEGLEVVRAAVDDDGVRLEVGIGRHDREAFQILHGDMPTAEALASVIANVREYRRLDAPPHPLNRLASERWLRARLLRDPSPLGLVRLEPASPPVPRTTVKDRVPAVAAGEDREGRTVLVVCSVGVDLDLVPFAADARLAHPADRLLLVVPPRDDHPVTRALAAALREPAEVTPVP